MEAPMLVKGAVFEINGARIPIFYAGRRRRHVPATPIIIRSAHIAHPLSSKQTQEG